MSVEPVEGRVVGGSNRRGPPPPRTEYVYVQDKGTNARRRGYRQLSYRPQQQSRVQVPSGVPAILGNREIIFGSWAIAMALVSWDEWKTHGILPRPLRLWDTTFVYAGLVLLSIPDALVPLASALAVGYTIALLYQFFSGSGAFSSGVGAALGEATI